MTTWKRDGLVAALVAAATAFGLPGHAAAEGNPAWNQWRGPTRDGHSPEKGWLTEWPKGGPKILWTNSEIGVGCASVAIGGKRLYTMGNVQVGEKDAEVTEKRKEKNADGKDVVTEVKVMKKVPVCEDTVFCLDADTGKVVWKHGWPQGLDPSGFEGGPSSTPCVDGNRVYVQGRTGRVSCFDAASGTSVWEYVPEKLGGTLFGGITASPFVDGGLLIAAGAAFDKETGKVAWKTKHGCSWSSPLPFTHGGKGYIAFLGNGGLAAVNPADGTEAWFFPWSSDQNVADPLIWGDKIFLSSRRFKTPNEQCAVLQLADAGPQVVWTNGNLMSYFQERVLVDGHIYGCDENSLKCLDPATGEVKWKAPGGRGQLIAADGKLLVMWGGTLAIVEASPAGYKELAKAKIVPSGNAVAPVLSGGRLYCRGTRGTLVCCDVGR